MTRFVPFLAAALLLAPLGCGTHKQSPEFERRWEAAKKQSGLDHVQVIDTRSASLKGNVQRLGDPFPPPSLGQAARKLPVKLSQNQVGRYIRSSRVSTHATRQLVDAPAAPCLP